MSEAWSDPDGENPEVQAAIKLLNDRGYTVRRKDGKDNFWVDSRDGQELCLEDECVAEMLEKSVLFLFERPYCETYAFGGRYYKVSGRSSLLAVNANDVFAGGGGDAEDLPHDQIPVLYKLWKSRKYGVTRWLCMQRGEQPKALIRYRMKEDGEWDEVMEGLKKNFDDRS